MSEELTCGHPVECSRWCDKDDDTLGKECGWCEEVEDAADRERVMREVVAKNGRMLVMTGGHFVVSQDESPILWVEIHGGTFQILNRAQFDELAKLIKNDREASDESKWAAARLVTLNEEAVSLDEELKNTAQMRLAWKTLFDTTERMHVSHLKIYESRRDRLRREVARMEKFLGNSKGADDGR